VIGKVGRTQQEEQNSHWGFRNTTIRIDCQFQSPQNSLSIDERKGNKCETGLGVTGSLRISAAAPLCRTGSAAE
jgi:hypothetical protein